MTRATGGRRFLGGLLPAFEDPVPIEMYRAIARIRFFASSFLIAMDLALAVNPERGGMRPDVYWYGIGTAMVMLAIDAVAGLWMWRRPPSVATMARANRVLAVLDLAQLVMLCWFTNTVHSHLVAFAVVLVLSYRFFFDVRTGLIALGTAVVGMWTVVFLENAHVLPVAPGLIGGVPPSDLNDGMRAGAMIFITTALVVGFLLANLAVARLSHKEHALRLLRENLAAIDPARMGVHSGRTLRGRYELRRVLGAGGMGEVYEGRHTGTGRRVAVKMLHRHLAQSGELVARFRREAEVTGALGSAHVVQILDVDEDDGQPFLVLEYLDGESLGARLTRGGAMPPAEVAEVIAQVAEGIDAAHAAGIVHRDLKPDNVFLAVGDEGVVAKILDFGISKIQGDATAITREIALLGTPDFMAPEQTRGDGQVGPAADRFALGAIAYTALTGVRPFAAGTIPNVLRSIVEDEPVPATERVPSLPRALDDALAIAMAKRPGERFATGAELARALGAAARGDELPDLASRARTISRGRRTSVADEVERDRAAQHASTVSA
jgi:hypothetical protein